MSDQPHRQQVQAEVTRGLAFFSNEVVPLGHVSAISGGVALGRSLTGPNSIELPYLRVANVQDGFIDVSEIKTVRILRAEIERYCLRKGDVLMTEGGDFDKLGRGAVWNGYIDPCLHQNHVFRVRCDPSVLLPEYLAMYSASSAGKQFFLSLSKRTTNLASINLTQLKEFPIPIPALKDQRRITEILGSADEAIRSTEQLIAKLELTKRGLLHDLLTRGVDDSGRLRDPESQPGFFVQTPLGLLPRTWNIAAIGAEASVFNGSTPSRLRATYWDNGKVPWLTSGKVNDYEIIEPSELITDRAVKECSLRIFPPGAVVVGMIGEGKTRGMSARLGISASINQNLAGIIPGPNLNGRFLHLFLTHHYEALRRGGRGSNQDALNTQIVSSFQIAIPSLLEQRSIEFRVDSVTRRVKAEHQELRKLRLVKQGLMDDLLTRRTRAGISL